MSSTTATTNGKSNFSQNVIQLHRQKINRLVEEEYRQAVMEYNPSYFEDTAKTFRNTLGYGERKMLMSGTDVKVLPESVQNKNKQIKTKPSKQKTKLNLGKKIGEGWANFWQAFANLFLIKDIITAFQLLFSSRYSSRR